MPGSSTSFLFFRSIWILMVYSHFSGENLGSDAVTHNVSVNMGTLGRIFSPGSAETGTYYNHRTVVWFLYVIDPANLELYVYPKHVDLESCCDRVTVTTMMSYTSSGETVTYTGTDQTPSDSVSVAALTALPTVHSASGMVKVEFTTDHSVTLSGFALRFFALHKYRVIPTAFTTLPAYSAIGQLAVQPHIPEFTVTAPERIWLQVVHMNLSLTSLDEMHHTECRYQTQKIELHDTFCSMDDCTMALLCRHPYSITPITLVSYGHEVVIRSTCTQVPSTDGAIINYKIYNPADGPGTCPSGTGSGHSYWQVHTFWALEHTWNVNSNPSALDITWWIENTNPVAELLIQVTENQLSRSPDCSTERIEIYSAGSVVVPTLDPYMPYATADPGYPQPDPGYYGPDNPGGYYGPYFGPYPQPEPQQPYGQDTKSVWDKYVGIWMILILVAVLVSTVVVAIQYGKKKSRSRTTVQHKFRGRSHPVSRGIPPAQQLDHRGSIIPQMPAIGPPLDHRGSIVPEMPVIGPSLDHRGSFLLKQPPTLPGIPPPPPSIYDAPPPAYHPYPGTSAVQITVMPSPHQSPHIQASPYRT